MTFTQRRRVLKRLHAKPHSDFECLPPAKQQARAAQQVLKEAEEARASAAKRRRQDELLAMARAADRTTDLTADELRTTLGELRLEDVQSAMCVCKVWRAAARATARNEDWQSRMLRAEELSKMTLSRSALNQWMQANKTEARR